MQDLAKNVSKINQTCSAVKEEDLQNLEKRIKLIDQHRFKMKDDLENLIKEERALSLIMPGSMLLSIR